MARKVRAQPRIKGQTRIPTGTSVLENMRKWVDREARIYGVSRSFVLANCVSFVFGIPMVSYRELDKQTTKLRLVGRR